MNTWPRNEMKSLYSMGAHKTNGEVEQESSNAIKSGFGPYLMSCVINRPAYVVVNHIVISYHYTLSYGIC